MILLQRLQLLVQIRHLGADALASQLRYPTGCLRFPECVLAKQSR